MIELRAANTRDLGKWSGPVFSQALAPSFTPVISVDGKSNVLDLLYFGFDRSNGQTASTMNLATFFTRYDAGRLVPIAGPTRIGTVPGALPIDLPVRHGPLDNPGGPYPTKSLFIGFERDRRFSKPDGIPAPAQRRSGNRAGAIVLPHGRHHGEPGLVLGV